MYVGVDTLPAWAWWTLGVLALLLVLWLLVVWRKGRPFAPGDVFRASRLSRGNRLFPTQVLITPTSVVQYTPQWIGRQEESIHMAHIASVKIITGLLLSDVLIETSGGARSDQVPRASKEGCRAHEGAHRAAPERILPVGWPVGGARRSRQSGRARPCRSPFVRPITRTPRWTMCSLARGAPAPPPR